ncbi:hypothetical protein IAG44_40315 [Streptomyces roseirectus]|uniref:Tetratricopeptide repeat protein n=1 Tax=Streptomyces roseirectus TaxID=2768066 RepID=A0A7H0IQI3_9ACTN|nr:hypothetical protein [Streptomyces roseirectus]QNP75049.1 hypothetical protein IAG44_40315 [Streptomyces roseirectus]
MRLTADPDGPGHRVAGLLARRDAAAELGTRADAGDAYAAGLQAQLLAGHGDVDAAIAALRPRLHLATDLAGLLADLLAGQGQVDEAVRVLREAVDAGESGAPWLLADFLARHGREATAERLRARGLEPGAPLP